MKRIRKQWLNPANPYLQTLNLLKESQILSVNYEAASRYIVVSVLESVPALESSASPEYRKYRKFRCIVPKKGAGKLPTLPEGKCWLFHGTAVLPGDRLAHVLEEVKEESILDSDLDLDLDSGLDTGPDPRIPADLDKKLRDLLQQLQEAMFETCNRLYNSGGIDTSGTTDTDNTIMAKNLISAAILDHTEDFYPYHSKRYIETIKNLRHF